MAVLSRAWTTALAPHRKAGGQEEELSRIRHDDPTWWVKGDMLFEKKGLAKSFNVPPSRGERGKRGHNRWDQACVPINIDENHFVVVIGDREENRACLLTATTRTTLASGARSSAASMATTKTSSGRSAHPRSSYSTVTHPIGLIATGAG